MRQRRSAFSLFELLVILALLGLLFALLLPAVAKARQEAVRAQSANNLKQIGLAAHNYLSTYNAFPPGNDDNHFSASAKLLPFIEQENLFRQLDFKKPATDDANKAVRATVIKVFVSPNDPQERVNDESGPTNYLFCAGAKHSLFNNNGVFFQNSKVQIGQIKDGTSNTVMTGETLKGDGVAKATDVRRQHIALEKDALNGLTDQSGVKEFADNQNIAGDRCAAWIDGRFLQGTFTGTRTLNDAKPDITCGGAGGLSGLRSTTDALRIGLCDGSVRSVNRAIDVNTWKSITSRDGGEGVPNF